MFDKKLLIFVLKSFYSWSFKIIIANVLLFNVFYNNWLMFLTVIFYNDEWFRLLQFKLLKIMNE